jgi:two-component system sensor histidine kinase/response regulator
MTIAKRLIVLVAVPLVVLIGLGIFIRVQLAGIETRTRFVADTQIASLAKLGNISRTYAELRVSSRGYLLRASKEEQAAAQAGFHANKANFTILLRQYADTLVTGDKDRRLLDEYRDLSSQYLDGAEKVMSLADAGRRDESLALLLGPQAALGARLGKASSEWIAHNEQLATTAGKDALDSIDAMQWRMLAAVGIALFLTSLLGWMTSRRIVNPIDALQISVETIARGDYAQPVPFTKESDETGMLARSIDVLKQGAAAMDEQRWIKANDTQLTNDLRGADSVADFGRRFVSSLVPMLGGGVAAFYIFESGLQRVRRVAAYGLAEDGGSGDTFALGQGLAGQCARERKLVTLSHLPPDYLRISSGLGGAVPTQSAAWPLMSQDTLLAVVEFASFREVRPNEQALLAELLPTVAMSLEILQRNLRTQELLEQTVAQQESIKASEERNRLILDSTAEGIFGVDTEGRITFLNPAVTEMLYFSAEELIGQGSHGIIHHHRADGSDYPREECPMFAAYTQGKASRIADEFLWRKDGTGLPVEYGAVPIHKNGTILGAVISFTDITERKRAETALFAEKEKAEAATKAKSDFLANMSHEIRTPMNAIIGLSHLALKTELTAKQRDYVSKVHNAGTSLLGIINDILDFSKIEAGKLDIETTGFSLDEVIASVSTVTAQKAHDKGLEFLVEVVDGVPPALVGDPLRMSQIITNLVNNAVKFTERGEIRLKAELLERTGEKVKLQFSIHDTGMGMTKEQSARLFQPFMQADSSTTRKHGGTGLGLTICRRLVELMGGQVWLESEPGVGSTFLFTVWLGVGTPHGRNRMVPEGLRDLRVLVVDDNSAAREVLAEALQGVAKQVDVVSSGAEAVAAVKQSDRSDPYGVVFMDWRMPGMDGAQAARLIKEDRQLGHTPAVIMVTAFGRDEVREQAEQAQVDGFLVKPVTRSMLVDSLVTLFAPAGSGGETIAANTGEDGGRIAGARILLTEDNEINQQIAVELLEGAGAQVQVANNGREAVEKIAQATYDLVLMDLQMPVMDGYQAAAKIRSDARFDHVPIIAMTAHATVEERQRCLDAGMADHISKPIDPVTMFATIAQHYRPGPGRMVEAAAPRSSAPDEDVLTDLPGIDTILGLKRVAGNRKLYLKLLRDFHRDYPAAVRAIQEAIDGKRDEEALRLAHTLKGVSGSLGAMDLYAAAGEVETALKAGDAGKATAGLPEVEERLQTVISGLLALAETAARVPAAGPAGEVNRDALGVAMKTLAELLRKNNPEAEVALETVTALCLGQWAESIRRLGLAVDTFDFKGAMKALEALAGEAGVAL